MELRLLGPVQIVADGKALPLGRRQERLLLALLGLSANQLVPADRLIELLWTDESPAEPNRTLQVYLSRLRKALPAGIDISSRDQAYQLDIDRSAVDVHRFRELCRLAAASPEAEERAGLLRQALDLWRGPALADVASEDLRHRLCAGLEEERLTTLEERIQADLEAGRSAELVPELAGLVAAHPTREGLLAAQLVALYRVGRRLDALELLAAAKRTLRTETGLDASPRLQELELAILQDDPALLAEPPSVVPRQLPPAPSTFVGRQAQVEALTGLLTERAKGSAGPAIVVSAISGMGGIGKSALAVEVAHRVSGLFPDGQLFLNLRGYGAEEPMLPMDALATALRGLGVPDQEVPAQLAEASARYRSLLAERKVLVVLDNASGPAVVEALLPGTGTSAAIVTSRTLLSGLDAALVQLDVLTSAEASELLQKFAGPARMAAEPDAAEALLEACGYLPLAIRILGARLAARPAWQLSQLVDRIADVHGRLDQLSLAGESIRVVFASSLEQLDRSEDALDRRAAEAFRQLGVPDSTTYRLVEAARVLGLDDLAAETVLERLVDAQLLETPAPEVYRLHDLLWAFAREQADAVLPQAEQTASIDRLLELYAAVAWQCQESRYPGSSDFEWSSGRPKTDDLPKGVEGELAFDWLDAAGAKLTAIPVQGMRFADTTRDAVVSLALGSSAYSFSRQCWPDAIRRTAVAVDVARERADQLAEGSLLADIAAYHGSSGDVDGAVEAYREALPLLAASGLVLVEMSSRNNLTRFLYVAGRYAEGLENGLQAIELAERQGDIRLQAGGHLAISFNLKALGEPERQRQHLDSALRYARAAGSKWQEAYILDELGQLDHQQARFTDAIQNFRSSIAVYDELSQDPDRSATIGRLGEVLQDVGDLDEAIPALETGLQEAVRSGEQADETRLRQRLDDAYLARTSGGR
ncbi:BTAD domain-containing putative transcriptional regulator [Kribbella sp. NPDC006257]|uniref:AfsR/SARP family transcriptional regulator n=1 Tax=Kribbella sp. NPDC006257 TaxID=3156738 RepID=UPI0033A514F5